jgi:hypothetical protein
MNLAFSGTWYISNFQQLDYADMSPWHQKKKLGKKSKSKVTKCEDNHNHQQK